VAALVVGGLVCILTVVGWFSHVLAGGGTKRGLASGFTITTSMSRTAMWLTTVFTRPQTRCWPWTPARAMGIELGVVRWFGVLRRRVFASLESVVLVFGPPGSRKTRGELANHAIDAAGAAVVTSTKLDIVTDTAPYRHGARLFNPAGLGGDNIPDGVAPLRFNPVVGCDRPTGAEKRADYLLRGAGEGKGLSDAEFWRTNAFRALRCLLAAAALDGRDLRTVKWWADSLREDRPIDLLGTDEARATFPGWADELRSFREADEKLRGSVSITLTRAFGFMGDPQVLAAICPGFDGEPFESFESFDARAFLEQDGTLYIVGEGEKLSPLFSALTGYIYEEAVVYAATQRKHRLDPPLTLVLDEAANICKVPLPKWSSTARGNGIAIIIGLQSKSQLHAVWGDRDGETVWNNAAIKVAFGGLSLPADLEALSMLSGRRWVLQHGRLAQENVLLPEDIAHLPTGVALLLHRNARAVLVTVREVDKRRDLHGRRQTTVTEDVRPARRGNVVFLSEWLRQRREKKENVA